MSFKTFYWPEFIIYISGTIQTLKRLQLAIHSKQKEFVAHPSVQQLLGAIWYDGLPGFRRLHIIRYVCVSFVYFIAAVCLHFCLHEYFFFLQTTTMRCEICLHVSIIFYYLYSRTKIFNGKIRQKTFPEIHFWIRIIHFLFIFACTSLTANRTYCDGCYK